MKVGYFCYNLSGTGPATRARDVIGAIASGTDIEVVVLTGEPDKVADGTEVHPIDHRRPDRALLTVRRAFADVDLVHVPINVYQVMFVRFAYYGPLVAGVGPGIQPTRRHLILGRMLGIDTKIKTHEYDTRWERFGYDTAVCTATIDTRLFRPYSRDLVIDCRSEYGFTPDDTVILYVGELTKEQGAHLVAEMAAQSSADGPNRYLVAGDGPLRHRFEERDDLVYEGFLDNREMPPLYNAADVTVAPRREDNTSNVGLESIACGTPTITTAAGPITSLFEDRETYVWSDRTTGALLSTVEDLVTDDARYVTQMRRGLETLAELDLTLDRAVEVHLDVYADVVG